jgi:hypothetical protein
MPSTLSNKELQTLIHITEDRFKSDGIMPNDVVVLYKKMIRATKKIAVQSAKSKGRDFQYWICTQIAHFLHITFLQADDFCPIHSREMGQAGSDIVFRTLEAQEKFPFTVECKAAESFELLKTIEQVKANQKNGTDWLIAHKRKALTEPIVIMAWSAFAKLLMRKGE